MLAGNDDMPESFMSSKFGRIRPRTIELAALESMNNGENDVITFSLLF